MLKNLEQMYLNLFKKLIQETAQATGDLIGNKNRTELRKSQSQKQLK